MVSTASPSARSDAGVEMSIFNFDGGWNRIFNPIPQRENVWG
jgi:hypothetical protein